MFRKCLVLLVIFGFVGIVPAMGLETLYNNKVSYFSLFVNPVPEKIKVQASGNGNVVQAVIPINQEEEKVEQQERIVK